MAPLENACRIWSGHNPTAFINWLTKPLDPCRMSMKTILLMLALAMVIPSSAFGFGASFSSPQLGFPKGTPPSTIDQVLHYLQKEVTFVDGSFINEFTTQDFSGSPRNVTDLIQLLHRSGFELKITFADLRNDRIAFRLFQNSHQSQTIITINTAKKDFKLSELSIQIPPSSDSTSNKTRTTDSPRR